MAEDKIMMLSKFGGKKKFRIDVLRVVVQSNVVNFVVDVLIKLLSSGFFLLLSLHS